jgi:hypothetical protein
MKKTTRIILWVLLFIGVGVLVYQVLPIPKKTSIVEKPYIEGVLKGTVSNTSYIYVLLNTVEKDSIITIKEGNIIRTEPLYVFDTIPIVDGAFSYTYRLQEPYVFPQRIFLANNSGTCELVSFQNPYIKRSMYIGFFCLDRGANTTLIIDGKNLDSSLIMGSPGTNAFFKREAENEAKAMANRKTLIQRKQAAERAKQVEDSILNAYKQLSTATMKSGRINKEIRLKPKYHKVP